MACSKSDSLAWREQVGRVHSWSRIWTRWRSMPLGSQARDSRRWSQARVGTGSRGTWYCRPVGRVMIQVPHQGGSSGGRGGSGDGLFASAQPVGGAGAGGGGRFVAGARAGGRAGPGGGGLPGPLEELREPITGHRQSRLPSKQAQIFF